LIPEKFRLPLGAACTIAVMIVGTFVGKETADNNRANRAVSFFGLVVFIGAFYATSRDRKVIHILLCIPLFNLKMINAEFSRQSTGKL